MSVLLTFLFPYIITWIAFLIKGNLLGYLNIYKLDAFVGDQRASVGEAGFYIIRLQIDIVREYFLGRYPPASKRASTFSTLMRIPCLRAGTHRQEQARMMGLPPKMAGLTVILRSNS